MSEFELSFERIRPHLLYEFQGEAQLLKAVEEMGKLFNFYRENLDRYRDDRKLVSAYCAYFLTTNYPKLFETAKLLGEDFDFANFDEIIDVGTGPGTFLLALDKLAKKDARLSGIDVSETMLEQAQRLLAAFASDRDVALRSSLKNIQRDNIQRDNIKREDGELKSLLMFTHSLNEMGADKGREYILEAKPEAVLLVEPGTKECFKTVLELRNWALTNGYQAAYPCFSNAACPLDPQKDWCHQYLHVSHSADVERMTQKLGRNRRLLPVTVQLWQKTAPARKNAARLIRVKKPTKHSVEWQLCEKSGGENKVFDAEAPKRGMAKKQVKELEGVMPGAEIVYKTKKELKDRRRIQLLPK